MRSSDGMKQHAPVLCIRQCRISHAEIVCEMMVASATPATPMEKRMTNTRFSATFTSPATVRKYSGRRVSPTARRMAAPKLYNSTDGMPTK